MFVLRASRRATHLKQLIDTRALCSSVEPFLRNVNISSCSSASQNQGFSAWKPATAQTPPASSLFRSSCRAFASTPLAQPPAAAAFDVTPPESLNFEMARGVHDATLLLVKYGVGHKRLLDIAKDAGNVSTLVQRWQRMMETYMSCQVHVMAGLGYAPSEKGIAQYNFHLSQLMQTADPESQQTLQSSGKEAFLLVLSTAFNVPMEELTNTSLSIVDARNVMHKVSQRMMEPEIIEAISSRVAKLSTGDPKTATDIAQRHAIVQDVLVNQVYLGTSKPTTLVAECGFMDENGEVGYVKMQASMVEHQADPLVQQYVGGAMMRILQAAGLDTVTKELAKEAGVGGTN